MRPQVWPLGVDRPQDCLESVRPAVPLAHRAATHPHAGREAVATGFAEFLVLVRLVALQSRHDLKLGRYSRPAAVVALDGKRPVPLDSGASLFGMKGSTIMSSETAVNRLPLVDHPMICAAEASGSVR